MRYLNFCLALANILIFFKVLAVIQLFSPLRQMADFDVYYRTIIDIRQGINPYTVSYMQNLGPPLVFLYFLPFTLFSLAQAQQIFLIMNLAAGYLTAYVLAQKFISKQLLTGTLILSAILYLSFLSRYSLQIGQPILLVGLLIALAITSPKPKIVGQALGLLIVLKTFFAFGFISIIKKYQVFVACLGLLMVLGLGSFIVIKPQWYLFYSQQKLIDNLAAPENPLRLNYENQTLKSTLARLKIPESYIPIWLTILVIGLLASYKTQRPEVGILFSFLLSPVLWQHYFAALFPIFVKAFFTKHNLKSWLILLVSVIFWWPDLRFLHTAVPNLLNGLLASHFYFSLILLTTLVTLTERYELFGP